VGWDGGVWCMNKACLLRLSVLCFICIEKDGGTSSVNKALVRNILTQFFSVY
jgi:hypothetical protein